MGFNSWYSKLNKLPNKSKSSRLNFKGFNNNGGSQLDINENFKK